jgi:hypothetical protein
MKSGGDMKNRAVPLFAILILLVSTSLAQERPELDELDQKIQRHFEKASPGWKHERVEPIEGSKNVLIEFWSLGNRKVKISILPHDSSEQAKEEFQNFAKYGVNREALKEVGDEAMAWGYGSSDIGFRRGKYTVYISTVADVDSDPDARSLTQDQRFEREKSEMRRLSREFAKYVAAALDAP